MDWEWRPDLDSARWHGHDLIFSAMTEAGVNVYVIRSHHLKNVKQRTGAEALSLNLPALGSSLAKLARGARSGQLLILS